MFSIPGWFGANLYCILLLLYIDISVRKAQIHIPQELKAYHNLLWYLIFSFIADSFSRLYAYESFQVIYPVIVFATYLKYIMLPLLVPMFFKFFLFQIQGEKPKYLKVAMKVVWVIQGLVTLIVLSSVFTHWALYFDENRIYHRGVLYKLPVSMMMFMGVLVEVLIVINKSRLPKKNFKIFSLFLLFPIIGGAFQSLFYGLALCHMGGAFSLIIVYIDIVSRAVNKDYLTGLNNRKTFDYYLDDFILDDNKYPFAAIMIDIDYFKEINDKLGHAVGDEALANTAIILQNSVRRDDIVCRYGGDEFAILLKNCPTDILELVIDRINKNVNKFNETSNAEYKLQFSIGSDVYDGKRDSKAVDFLKGVDDLMYRNKKKRKEKSSKDSVIKKADKVELGENS